LFFIKRKESSITIRSRAEGCLFTVDIAIGKKVFPNAMKCVLYKEDKNILIGDIYVCEHKSICRKYLPYVNKGYGTQMMNELLRFSKENGYIKITGNLSEVDQSTAYDPTHRERQIHFYKKFGFRITSSEEDPQGIELNL